MQRSSFSFALAAGVLAFGLGSAGCSKPKSDAKDKAAGEKPAPEASKGVKIRLKLSKKERARAEKLATALTAGRFSSKARRDNTNSKVFLYLAATSSDPTVIAAALEGMKARFTTFKKSKTQTLADEDYGAVIAARLKHKDNKVVGWALAACSPALRGDSPSEATTSALLEIGNTHELGPARRAALDCLRNIRGYPSNKKITAVFLKALGAKENYVVSSSLFYLKSYSNSLANKGEFLKQARQLLKHKDPGVRGRAAQLAGALAGKSKGAVAKEIFPLLDDKNAFTRSAAIGALTDMDARGALHKIVKLLDDNAKNTYDIRGFKELTGRPGWVHHDGSAWSRVNDAALYSCKRFSYRIGKKFTYKVKYKKVEEDLAKAAGEAKKWYAGIKAKLPPSL